MRPGVAMLLRDKFSAVVFILLLVASALCPAQASATGLFGLEYGRKSEAILKIGTRTYDCEQFFIGANNWEIRSYFCDGRIIHIQVKYPQGMEDSFTNDAITKQRVEVNK